MPGPRRERTPQQLPPGRHGLPRDLVAQHQRQRLVAALLVVVAERGFANTSIDHIIREAGVSRRTFYEHFESKDVMFTVAYAELAAEALGTIRTAVEAVAEQGFTVQVVAGIRAGLEYVAAHEDVAQMLLVDVLAAGADAVQQRAETLATLTAMLNEAAKADQSLAKTPPVVSATVIGGLYEAVYSRVAERRGDQLLELLPDLTYFTLLPYLGAEVARKEHKRLRRQVQRAARGD